MNIPVADVRIDLRLDGDTLSGTNTTDSDYGRIFLKDPKTGETIYSDWAWDTYYDQLNTPFEMLVVAGVYEVYYDRGSSYQNWPLNDDAYLGTLDLSTDGDHVVNIPVASVEVDLTLDSEVLDGTNTTDSDYGRIFLKDPKTGESIYSDWAWDTYFDTLNTPFSLLVVENDYEVYYDRGSSYQHWPLNDDAYLGTFGFSTDGQHLIDIPVASVQIDLTLDAEVLGAANTTDSDYGRIFLKDPKTGESIYSDWAWDTYYDTLNTPFSMLIVENEYEVYYDRGSSYQHWPLNDDAYLGDFDFTVDGAHVVDIPVSSVAIDLTLDSAALDGSNTTDSDYGRIFLKDPKTGESIYSDWAWDTYYDTLNTPFSMLIVENTYGVYYDRGSSYQHWPLNDDAYLGDVDLSTDGAHVVNIPVASVAIDLTLSSETLDGSNTTDSDYGRIFLKDPKTGETIYSDWAWDTYYDTLNTPFSMLIVENEYEVYYDRGSSYQHWPLNDDAYLGDFDFSSDGAHVVDIPAAHLCLDLTLDGAELSTSNTKDSDYGRIFLKDPKTGEAIYSDWAWDTYYDEFNTPFKMILVAGPYEAYYDRGSSYQSWPLNDDAYLGNVQVGE